MNADQFEAIVLLLQDRCTRIAFGRIAIMEYQAAFGIPSNDIAGFIERQDMRLVLAVAGLDNILPGVQSAQGNLANQTGDIFIER